MQRGLSGTRLSDAAPAAFAVVAVTITFKAVPANATETSHARSEFGAAMPKAWLDGCDCIVAMRENADLRSSLAARDARLEILGRESRQQVYVIAELKRQLKEAATALVVPSHVRPAPSTWEDIFPGAYSCFRHSRKPCMPSLACIRIVSPNRDCTCVRARMHTRVSRVRLCQSVLSGWKGVCTHSCAHARHVAAVPDLSHVRSFYYRNSANHAAVRVSQCRRSRAH